MAQKQLQYLFQMFCDMKNCFKKKRNLISKNKKETTEKDWKDLQPCSQFKLPGWGIKLTPA